MTMDFSDTLDAFASPLPIYVDDVEGQYIDAEWTWGDAVRRLDKNGNPKRLQAIVLALSVQTLFFYGEGNVSDGGIALLTQEQLYFTNVTNAGPEDRQTYIIYQNMRFRVVGDGFISQWNSLIGNANFKCYHCLRAIE